MGSRRLAMLLVLLAGTAYAAPSAHVDVKRGQPFPDLAFEALLAAEDYGALGLPEAGGPFQVSQIPGEVLVLEFFNKSCVPCQRQVRQLQAFYERVRSGELASRVRILAIGAGNQPKYLPKYRKKRGLTFPITADPDFDQWRRLGEPGRTPFTVLVQRREGRWILAASYFGVQEEGDLERHVLALLAGTLVAAQQDPEAVPPKQYHAPSLTAEQELALARRFLTRVAGTEVRVDRIDLPEGGHVYRATTAAGMVLYAKVAHREPVCEICHSVHFLFAFDGKGRVRGFEPIHVTKYGNQLWTPEDVRYLDRRLDGRTMAGLKFDPEVDAVSMATMSSALVFDEVRRTAALLKELKER